jgi:hypothetical protein
MNAITNLTLLDTAFVASLSPATGSSAISSSTQIRQLIPQMTSDSSSLSGSGWIITANTWYNPGNNLFQPYRACDKNTGSLYWTNGGQTGQFYVQLSSSHYAVSYYMQLFHQQNWNNYGSNDNQNWTYLNSVIAGLNPDTPVSQSFNLPGNVSYQYYKIDFLGCYSEGLGLLYYQMNGY